MGVWGGRVKNGKKPEQTPISHDQKRSKAVVFWLKPSACWRIRVENQRIGAQNRSKAVEADGSNAGGT
jgi:hypothetical protein